MVPTSAMIPASAVFLFSTHMTRNKMIAITAVAIMLVVAGVAWLVRWQRSRTLSRD